jgi:hypothetical protein
MAESNQMDPTHLVKFRNDNHETPEKARKGNPLEGNRKRTQKVPKKSKSPKVSKSKSPGKAKAPRQAPLFPDLQTLRL